MNIDTLMKKKGTRFQALAWFMTIYFRWRHLEDQVLGQPRLEGSRGNAGTRQVYPSSWFSDRGFLTFSRGDKSRGRLFVSAFQFSSLWLPHLHLLPSLMFSFSSHPAPRLSSCL